MSDLIDRQAAIDVASHECEEFQGVFGRIEKGLKKLPSAQPERKRGWWVKMSDRDGVYWACSECGEDIPRISHFNPQFDLFPRLESIDKTNYCPNCGRKLI